MTAVATAAIPLAAVSLLACTSAEGSAEVQVLVKLAAAAPARATPSAAATGTAIAVLAGDAAATPARYVSAVSDAWHAVALRCGSAVECDAAVQRLRAAGAFEAVQYDGTKRIAPAVPASSR